MLWNPLSANFSDIIPAYYFAETPCTNFFGVPTNIILHKHLGTNFSDITEILFNRNFILTTQNYIWKVLGTNLF